jgi:hypothetical protein
MHAHASGRPRRDGTVHTDETQ